MDIEDDDDFYAPEEPKIAPADEKDKDKEKPAQTSDDLEEGEEEDEGAAMDEDDDDSDSDIDIITERKDGTTAAPPPQSKYSDIRNIPQRSTSNDAVTAAPVKKEEGSKSHGSAQLGVPIADKTSAAASKSTIDINGNPVYAPAGKPITQVSIDEDLPENEKPWRKPGTDISDYFNYGFDEFTWALYAAKQDSVRGEYGADVFATNSKKMMDEFNSMMMMGGGGMPGMGGAGAGGGPGGGGGGAGGGMPGMDGIPPEMQQMMQQMMQSGMDPSQMDPSQMAAMMAGGQGGQGGQGQGFGGGFGGNQGDFGFNQNMGGGGGGGRGGFGGRGRGRRWQ